MANDILITPASASIQFSGSAFSSIKLTVDVSGSLLVIGSSGSLFGITDNLSGSLMSVNTVAGLPILEVFSDNRVNIGKYASEAIKVQSGGSDVAFGSGSVMFITSSGRVGIGVNVPVNKLDVAGNISCSAITASTFFGTASVSTGVSGGTNNYIPLWTGVTTLSSSKIYQTGSSVLIGQTTFTSTAPESLAVSGSTFNIISGYGSLNNYLQLNIKNSNAGNTGSSDIVATNNQGTETQYYVDLGINSSGHVAQGDVGQANDGYLYNTGSDFYIGNATPNKNLYLYAGSATNTSSVALSSTGNFGIGNASPGAVLDVTGDARFTGNVGIGGLAGTDGTNAVKLTLIGLGSSTTALKFQSVNGIGTSSTGAKVFKGYVRAYVDSTVTDGVNAFAAGLYFLPMYQ